MFNRNYKAIDNIRKNSENFDISSQIYIPLSVPNLKLIKSNGAEINQVSLYGSDRLIRYGYIDRETFKLGSHNDSGFNINSSQRNTFCSLSFGSGNTPPTINDVNLEREYEYATNLRQIEMTFSKTFDVETETVKKTIRGVYYAITDMNISELGITSCVRILDSVNARILMSRDVLSEPLVVTAGQTFSVTLTIEEKLQDIGEVLSASAEIE